MATSRNHLSPRDLRRIFQEGGKGIRRRWGQNFLVDPNQIDIICNFILYGVAHFEHASQKGESSFSSPILHHDELASATSEPLLEIGPGPGALTREMLGRGYRICAIEIDPFVSEFLKEDLSDYIAKHQFRLIRGDALELLPHPHEKTSGSDLADSPELSSNIQSQFSPRVIYGNLPYYITTDLILRSSALPGLERAVFLTQYEFAKRVQARSAESSITVYLHNLGEWKMVHTIPPDCFYPKPTVKSGLLLFTPYQEGPRVSTEALERVLRASFSAKRKKLKNSWKMGDGSLYETLMNLAADYAIDTTLRAEALTFEQFFQLANGLVERRLG